tara:strand:+ start:352 stop:744 length:393 start_codon:yes stop_codon:yes gene_type:complete
MVNPKIERGTDKSFGIVFTIVFLIVALYPMTNSAKINIWALIISVIFLLFALIRPKSLSFLNILWSKLGYTIGGIMAPIVMFIVYFLTVVPTGLIMKFLGKDLLNQKFNKKANSYWIKREKPVGSMKNQF